MRGKNVYLILGVLLAAFAFVRPGAARDTYWAQANCAVCHSDGDTPTCNGCHQHGLPTPAALIWDKPEYDAGSTMTLTVGGSSAGWAQVRVYDNPTGIVPIATSPQGNGDNGVTTNTAKRFPFAFTLQAPNTPGDYTYYVAVYGSPWTPSAPNAYPHGVTARVATSVTVVGEAVTTPVLAAEIDIVPISPRMRDANTSDVFTIRSSGLEVVGVNKPVYLAPKHLEESGTTVTGYAWAITRQPSAGAAVIDSTSPTLFKFHPSVAGEYEVSLTPTLTSGTAEVVKQRILAAKFLGQLTTGTQTGLSCATCHAAVKDRWDGTKHALKLTRHLNGDYTNTFRPTCLECHALGYDKITTGNDNFNEIGRNMVPPFDEAQIQTWVADAITTNGPDHWPDLPAPLQLKGNIQCEECHGPGSAHNGVKANIVGSRFDGKACRQCHEAAGTKHFRPYQWDYSGHATTDLAGDGEVEERSNCYPCHTAEGFVYVKVEGQTAIPATVHSRNPVTCTACHSMHPEEEHPAQLRTVGAFTLPNKQVFDKGLGNLCVNCHNSRIANARTSAATSYRGAHYGPQSDVMLGTTAYDWGRPYNIGPGIHYMVVEDSCVHCHMAASPVANGAVGLVGDHTFFVNNGGVSNAERACGTCHPGLTTTDRVPPVAVDYDGDGFTSGVQTEIGGLLEIVKARLLHVNPELTYDEAHKKIVTRSYIYAILPLDIRAVIFNFNLISLDKSLGIHNSRYAAAVLQRSYRFATGGTPFKADYPNATIADNFTEIPASQWKSYE